MNLWKGDCSQCNAHLNRNSFYKESSVIIVDSFSNYAWVERLSNSEQGTSRQIINAMRNQLGTGLHLTKKILQDNAKNLNWDKIKDWCQKYGIKHKNSTAYHPAGNLLAERTICHVKTTIGDRSVEKEMDEILALNLAPRSGEALSPFEFLHSIASPVSVIH